MSFRLTMKLPDSLKSGGLATAAVLTSYFLIKKLRSRYKAIKLNEEQRAERLIVISGCDTGLGYSMAVWAAKLGYRVLAGCLNENGEGPLKLIEEFPEQIFTTRLNVVEKDSLENLLALCKEILEAHKGKLELWAIVPNAAVSTMGEFFWQTQGQREQQMDVNFWGTVDLITEFRTLLFQSKPRVIVISSDCSEYPLPYLSTYSASKAALNSWTQSFRFEMIKYGVPVVAYQPRDFAQKSGLFSNMEHQYNQMVTEMDNEDRKFYGQYFDKFMKRKQEVFKINQKRSVKVVDSYHHRNGFVRLLEKDISGISIYRDSAWYEKVFHGMYKTLPQSLLDKLANLLLNPDKIQWNEPKH